MPYTPSGLSSTMIGLWTLQLLATGNQVLDRIRNAIMAHEQPTFLRGIDAYAVGVAQNIFNAIIDYLVPAAPGVFNWLRADASWLEQLSSAISHTLKAHRDRIHYLQYTALPTLQGTLTSAINSRYSSAIAYTTSVQNTLNRTIVSYHDSETSYVQSVQRSLNTTINNNMSVVRQYVIDLNRDINSAKVYAQQLASAAVSKAEKYTTDQVNGLRDWTNVKLIALTASIAALSTYITAVYVPGAIAAAVAALNAEAAAAVDVEWEIVATQGNKALAQLTLADLDPTWAALTLSEIPATSIAAADLDIVAALHIMTAYLGQAGVPLYRNLKQFGEDTAELDGFLTTALLGAFFTAAVADPSDTAAVVTTTLLDPLVSLLTAVGGIFGLQQGT